MLFSRFVFRETGVLVACGGIQYLHFGDPSLWRMDYSLFSSILSTIYLCTMIVLSLLILLVASPALAVDIVMTYLRFGGNSYWISVAVATCPSLPPGICCEAISNRPASDSGFVHDNAYHVTFRGMLAGDIGAVWGAHTTAEGSVRGGCSGRVIETRRGPGDWQWRGIEAGSEWRPATGAQYVSLPKRLPPDPAANRWMSMQGILEMAYGGGKWFTTPAAERLCGPATGRSRRWLKGIRDIRSPLKGDLCIGPAPTWRYPELVVVNGSEYSDAGRGDLRYADAKGNVLDLRQVFSM